ncbi:MAG: ABC transporter permease, partial [bacterium]
MKAEEEVLEVDSGTLARTWDRIGRFLDSDIYYSFRQSPVTIFAFLVTLTLFLAAALAPWIAPHQTLDVKTLDLMNAFLPPAWEPDSDPQFLLGTDDQGRDIFSAIMFGLQISLGVGFASVVVSAVFGTLLGLLSGYVGGRLDSFIMRVADIQLTFPAILIALLIDGIVGSLLPKAAYNELKLYVLVLAIAASQSVTYARTVRGSTLVE